MKQGPSRHRPGLPTGVRAVRPVLVTGVASALLTASLLGTMLTSAPHMPRAGAGIAEAAVAARAPAAGDAASQTPDIAAAASGHYRSADRGAAPSGDRDMRAHRRAPRGGPRAMAERTADDPRSDAPGNTGPTALANLTAGPQTATASHPVASDYRSTLARFVSKASRTRGQPQIG